MKKFILSSYLFVIICIGLQAQTAYMDAVELRSYINNNGRLTEDASRILDDYGIHRMHTDNRFLEKFLPIIEVSNSISAKKYSTPLPSPLSTNNNILNKWASIGGLNVTPISDGMAKFIVKRSKQELSIAFFEKFKEDMDSIKDLQTVFPQTWTILSSIGENIYMYDVYIQTLKASFERDLASLPSNLPQLIYEEEEYFDTYPELKAELLTAFYFAQSIQTNQHPGIMIENYPIHYLDPIHRNIKAGFQTIQLFSKSLKGNNDSLYWISINEANKLMADTVLFKLYLGLIMQQAKMEKIVFADGEALYEKMNETKYQDYSQYIYTLVAKAQILETQIKTLNRPQKKDSLLYEKYYASASSVIDLMQFAIKGASLFPNPEKYNWEQQTKPYFNFSQAAVNLAIDVNRKNYSSAIVNTISILKVVCKGRKDSVTVLSQLLKYGSFMATVAQAKKSDEVEAAIEAAALPTGSARIKRESKWNVSLNAYCGLFSGYEKIEGVDAGYTDITFKKWNSIGITAPIGFAVSKGHSMFFFDIGKYGWSSTVFISVVDIGALAAYRFPNDSTESAPTIQLQDIISPGIFYSVGLPKVPISINIGYQFGPVLRKVTTTTNTYSDRYTRFSISACVDIPIVNFYNSSR